MKPYDLLYISYQSFKNRRSRVFFTILGVAVAIAVVLSLVSFGYGLQKSLLEQITTEESLLSLDIIPSDPLIIKFDNEMVEEIAKIASVERVSPQATFTGSVLYSGVRSEVSLNVIEPDFLVLDGKNPLAGKLFGAKDKRKAVVSSTLAELFQLTPEEMIGENLNVSVFIQKTTKNSAVEEKELSSFEVIGVVEGKQSSGDVYIQHSDAGELEIAEFQVGKVKVKNEGAIETVRTTLIERGFIVSSLSDIVNQANKIFNAIQIALGIFGIFALIVAAIGLVNTMTISLLERTNEIGIMRAIGAAPADIKRIFLGESIAIGFLGGIFGIALGIVASELLNFMFNLLAVSLGGNGTRLFVYPFWFIVFIIFISTLVGLGGGIWPAYRASKMNPLEALRYK